jgi:hypothetical protein
MSTPWWPFRSSRKRTPRNPLSHRPRFDTLEDRLVPAGNSTFATAAALAPPNARLETTPVEQWQTVRDNVSKAEPNFYKITMNAAFGLAVDMKTGANGAGVVTEVYDGNQKLLYGTVRFQGFAPVFIAPPSSFSDEELSPLTSGIYLDLGPGTFYVKVYVPFGTNSYTMRLLTDTVYSADVPEFNSNPGAPVSAHLDFDGHSSNSPTEYWVNRNAPGGYSFSAINFRGDGHVGDPTTFSPGERLFMANTWKRTAEDFAPFNINVTTKNVPLAANGVPLGVRSIITNTDDDKGWRPGAAGYAPLNSMSLFMGEGPAINFATTDVRQLPGNGVLALRGFSTVSHELAHAFGVEHQWGLKTSTPDVAPGRTAPVSIQLPGIITGGTPYAAEDTLRTWLIGINSPVVPGQPGVLQSDMDVIAKPENRAGYRTDDAGNTRAAAVALTAANNSFKKTGIIEKSADVDFYSFAAAGKTSITVDVPSRSSDPNLITLIELQDAAGNVVAQGTKTAGDRAYVDLHATLTVRTDDESGQYTLPAGHGLSVGDIVIVSWGDRGKLLSRYAVRVTAVAGNLVTLADGYSDERVAKDQILPRQGVELLVAKALPLGKSTITADNLAAGTYYLKVSGTGRRSTEDPNNFIENVGQYFIDIRTDVPAVNQPPVVTLPGADFSYQSKSAAKPLDAAATVTDADSPDFNGGSLTVTITANGNANDALAIASDAVVEVAATGELSYNGDVIGSVAVGNGVTPLVVTFNSNKATPAAAQEILRRVTFASTVAVDAVGLARTISIVARDRQGGNSAAVTRTVTVTAPVQPAIRVLSNRGLTVPINAPKLIETDDLKVEGPADPLLGPAPVEYTVTQVPRHGDLVLAATAGVPQMPDFVPVQLKVGDKFQQADIDAGRLAYRLTPGSTENSDQFSFTATDHVSGTVPDTVFNIRVSRGAAPVAGNPVQPFGFEIGAPFAAEAASFDLSVTIEATPVVTVIGANRLSFLGDPHDLRYDIISGPTYGSLNRPTTFTQKNINDNGFSYTAPKAADLPVGVRQDSFTYVVTDVSTGGVSDPITFVIGFDNPNNAPQFIAGASTVTLPTILPVGSRSSAVRIQDVVDGIVNDPDDVTGETNGRGVAITGVDNSHGNWEFTTNGGSTWLPIPSNVSDTNALLLTGIGTLTGVRFTADGAFNGSAQFNFRLWDGFHVWDETIEGTSGQLFDTTSSTANSFSLATGSVVQPVMAAARQPSFTAGAEVVSSEDAGIVVVPQWATDIDGDNLGGPIVFVVQSPDGGPSGVTFLKFPTIAADGTLTFQVAPGSSGTVTLGVIISSNFEDSDVGTLTITVNSINDAPTLVVGPSVRVASTAGNVALVGWATGISRGASEESDQTLTVQVTTDHPDFFAVQPALDLTDGTLTFTPKVGASGTARVYFNLLDDGGTDNGGVAGTSRSTTITLTSGLPVSPQTILWIKQLYRDVLGREAESTGLAGWALVMGSGATREIVARAFLSSPEYLGIQVANLYRTLLRREPDAGGLSDFTNALVQGASLRTVRETFLSSAEYYATQGGGSDAGFVAALYRDILGRAADPTGAMLFTDALQRFRALPGNLKGMGNVGPKLSPFAVAQAIVESKEASGIFVDGQFRRLLGRSAETGAVDWFSAMLLNGARETDVLVEILRSTEYFNRAH